MGDFEAIGKQFVQFYYSTFDTNRSALSSLYRDESMLTFETDKIAGVAAIVEKLTNLPFQKVEHKTDSVDAQPADAEGGILVLVTGALLTEGQERPMSFVQTFHLKQAGGSYFVFNDIFRLVYPAA
ncbi:putative nuclear transport factor NTF-2 [Westerdykella ornata]|uniref:Nuclear transport factor 2 n=1 Tax=Westerdykella ornata TaxID=318751 RepID=A0A6A6JVG8_WESOR|nr:putative nuclear transport factor NTF-2 [Westerdykella ornata]KAF2280103.1 putative nuclear transport factor NTF-2 [Westerdykella ornata]